MVTFKTEENILQCTFPVELTPDCFKKSYKIGSRFGAYLVYKDILKKCRKINALLTLSEQLLLWRELEDICFTQDLTLFLSSELKEVQHHLKGSQYQHTSTQLKRVAGFLNYVEREILFDLKQENRRIVIGRGGEAAPYSVEHSEAFIPSESPY